MTYAFILWIRHFGRLHTSFFFNYHRTYSEPFAIGFHGQANRPSDTVVVWGPPRACPSSHLSLMTDAAYRILLFSGELESDRSPCDAPPPHVEVFTDMAIVKLKYCISLVEKVSDTETNNTHRGSAVIQTNLSARIPTTHCAP